MPLTGPGLSRVDGPLKVTGRARYTAEVPVPHPAYAVLLQSTISSGKVKNVDLSRAQTSGGFIAAITHENAIRLRQPLPNPLDEHRIAGLAGDYLPLQDNVVRFNGQHIVVIIADTLEQAQFAASLVTVEYETASFSSSLKDHAELAQAVLKPLGGPPIVQKGSAQVAFDTSKFTVSRTYEIATEHHHPMELSATTAMWEGSRLTVFDSSQFVFGVRETLRAMFGLQPGDVRVISRFVGGGFGSKRAVWPHITLAAMASRIATRPVKLMLTRAQMFTSVGYRSPSIQRVAMGADEHGQLISIIHDNIAQSPVDDEFVEPIHRHTTTAYAVPNLYVRNRVVHLNVSKPTVTRSPGNATGSFAIESSMDELAHKMGIDPVEFRLLNDAPVHPVNGKPWSSRALSECLTLGASRFGWSERAKVPASRKEGHVFIGYGMAAASYPVAVLPASARVKIGADGGAVVMTASHEIGQGAYTVLGQIAADALGLKPDRVIVLLGDTRLPPASPSAAAATTSSVGSAVLLAAQSAATQLAMKAAADPASPLFGLAVDEIVAANGQLTSRKDVTRRDSFVDILGRSGEQSIEALANFGASEGPDPWAKFSFGAQFCEVRVDPDLGQARVSRMLAVVAGGRILNAKTARSQIIGGMVWGIGMALHEASQMDHRYGRFSTQNLADYLVPTHADVPALDALFVEESDMHVNPLGVKGIGELGNVGVAAAIGNAIYNATGRRVTRLPIRPEFFV